MILFAREGLGTHFNPESRTVSHVPLGKGEDFRLVSLDTGTDRPGLEKSTYRLRRAECEKLAAMLERDHGLRCLADVKERDLFDRITAEYRSDFPELCDRLSYIFFAQKRFDAMLEAWTAGNIRMVGHIFREDGLGLRDVYKISGPELETMCDIARTVEGVFGERMLGGGDKGASGALAAPDCLEALENAVRTAYPRSYPLLADKYTIHVLKMVEGVRVFKNLL